MSSIFTATKTPTGYTWTITSKLDDILNKAEAKYGPRDKSYTILGIEFNTDSYPQIWYPGNNKKVIIQISQNCLNDINRAVFQVAHEAIHCLCPNGNNVVNVLKEGLANLFSIEYCAQNGHGDFWTSDQQKYTDASDLVIELLKYDIDIIKKLRAVQPTISLIDKKLIMQVNSSVPESLIDSLIEKF